ncbi:MAG: hypothetical protein Q8N60_03100, partial [Candidatus Diapherotrites archaeon]|nr:hypothetical protein [Candidatus Diapherotrites archaeon]
GMLRSLLKYAVLLLTLGSVNIDKRSAKIAENPEVFRKRYIDAIKQKKARARVVTHNIGNQMGIQETQKEKAAGDKADIKELENEIEGIFALRDDRIRELKAKGITSQEQIMADLQIQQLIAKHQNASTTLQAKKEALANLEEVINGMEETVESFVLEAQNLADGIRNDEREMEEGAAALGLAKALEESRESMAGIGEDTADETIKELKDIVLKAKGRAKASARIARVEDFASKAALKNAASKVTAKKEFLKGLTFDIPASEKISGVAELSKEAQAATQERPRLTE